MAKKQTTLNRKRQRLDTDNDDCGWESYLEHNLSLKEDLMATFDHAYPDWGLPTQAFRDNFSKVKQFGEGASSIFKLSGENQYTSVDLPFLKKVFSYQGVGTQDTISVVGFNREQQRRGVPIDVALWTLRKSLMVYPTPNEAVNGLGKLMIGDFKLGRMIAQALNPQISAYCIYHSFPHDNMLKSAAQKLGELRGQISEAKYDQIMEELKYMCSYNPGACGTGPTTNFQWFD